MKVLLVNGSPHKNGCTFTALCEVEKELKNAGIETEIFWLGNAPIRGCIACGGCKKNGNRCVFNDDVANRLIDSAEKADGFIFGAPVHYAAAADALGTILDRAFYAGGKYFAFKPGAAVVSCRRAGTTASLDRLNKFFMINNMPVVSSEYWNMVHGTCPGDVLKDEEGLQVMRTLGRNMAWLLKCIDSGEKNGIQKPALEARLWTNFIR